MFGGDIGKKLGSWILDFKYKVFICLVFLSLGVLINFW